MTHDVDAMKLVVLLFAATVTLSCRAQQNVTNGPSFPSVATHLFHTGVRGLVQRSPIRPHSRLGQVNAAPIPNALVTVSKQPDGNEITRGKTDENGRFGFELPPGKYVVSTASGGSRPRSSKKSIEVVDHSVTNVVLTIDTGIR